MHLHSRRSTPGDDADFGFDPLALEGDAREVGADEGPALFPFAADFPPSLLAESSSRVDEPHDARVLVRVRDLEGLGRRLDAIMVLRSPPTVVTRLANLVDLIALRVEGTT